jgi:hypothetical protein
LTKNLANIIKDWSDGAKFKTVRTPICHAGGRGCKAPPVPPNSARLVIISGMRHGIG